MSNAYPHQKTLSSYLLGFALSAVLTLLAFALVCLKYFARENHYILLILLAFLQLLVQSYFFLRLNASQEGRWNLIPFLFTGLLILIMAGGSLWVMYNLNNNM